MSTLGSEITFLSGGTPKKSVTENWFGDIPWVSSGEMNQRFIRDTEHHVSEEAAQSGTRRVPNNTVLVVVRGMSLAKEFRIAMTRRDVTFNQDLKALTPKASLKPEFLFYYMLSQREAIRGAATEASHGTKKLELRVLEEWPLPVPSEPEQTAVVDVIGSYDDLIENNRRRIQLLAESARLLYREWFVHLRFPGHEHVKVVDGVPKDWLRRPLRQLSSYINRGIAPSYDDEGDSIAINQRCIRDGHLALENARKQNRSVKEEKLVHFGDILINSTGTGTLGRVAQVWMELQTTTVDTHVTIVRPSNLDDALWLGFALRGSEALFASMAEGSTGQTELKRQKILDFDVLVPPERLRKDFSEFASDVVSQIVNLQRQNERLAQARDLLLPRLMNGEIAV